MPINYRNQLLTYIAPKVGGKNQSSVDGFYRAPDNSEYFVKKPEDKRELFTELFAGLLIEQFKMCGLVRPGYDKSLICADFLRLDDGSYALIQPKVKITELFHIIGTAYGNVRNASLEAVAGAYYYPLVSRDGYFFGLPTVLCFSKLLGDDSVHSANVVRLDFENSGKPAEKKQYGRIDWGAAFRHFGHPQNNTSFFEPYEYQGTGNVKHIIKGYWANYRNVRDLFPSMSQLAAGLQQNLHENRAMWEDMVAKALQGIPVDLIDEETKRDLAVYMHLPGFAGVNFNDPSTFAPFIVPFVDVLDRRLGMMIELRNEPVVAESEDSDLSAPLVFDKELPFVALMANLKWQADLHRGERVAMDVSKVDVNVLVNRFNEYVEMLAMEAEVSGLWPHEEGSRCNFLTYFHNGSTDTKNGTAFVPFYRESTVLRRMYLIQSASGSVRLHHYDKANDIYIREQHEGYWRAVNETLSAGTIVINIIKQIKNAEPAMLPAFYQQLYTHIDMFANKQSEQLNQLQIKNRKEPADNGSFYFYPITDDELDAMSGAQLATICLEEFSASDVSPLLVRIICDTDRWHKMQAAITDTGDFDCRPNKDLTQQYMITWRKRFDKVQELHRACHEEVDLQNKSHLFNQLRRTANKLPGLFRRVLEHLVRDSQVEIEDANALHQNYEKALSDFNRCEPVDKLHAWQVLNGAWGELPVSLQTLTADTVEQADKEYFFLKLLFTPPPSEIHFVELERSFEALAPAIKRQHQSIFEDLRSIYTHNYTIANKVSGNLVPSSIEQSRQDLFPVWEALDRWVALRDLAIDESTKARFKEAIIADKTLWFAVGNQSLSQAQIEDLLALKRFHDEKILLHPENPVYTDSVSNFYNQAVRIRLSDQRPEQQTEQMVATAQRHFKHRHLSRRLLADALMMIGFLFVGIGFVMGALRVANGKTFFFSSMPTDRETAFRELITTPEDRGDDSENSNLLRAPEARG